LINGLKNTKEKASEIEIASRNALITEKKINEERNKYVGVAAEGAMLYFLVISLNVVDHMYQYSLESFNQFFAKAIMKTEEHGEERVPCMILMIREVIYQWISRGLFEKHKIIFLTLMTFRLMQRKILEVEYTSQEMKFLLNCKMDRENTLREWLPNSAWFSVQRLGEIDAFKKFPESIEKELPSRFKEWFFEQNPENSNLPSKWKKLNGTFQKLLVLRALRPDRMIAALTEFIKTNLPKGEDFINMDQQLSFAQILKSAYVDATQ
jgi:dynein heavy chain, axonemal